MRRRDLLGALASAAMTSPLAAHAQQAKMPVIGFLNGSNAETLGKVLAAFHQGLNQGGFAEGRSVGIEYRWLNGEYQRAPSVAAELVSRGVTVIVAGGGLGPLRAAKAASTSIPIVFSAGVDPVKAGLVPSLSRPGGNITGITQFTALLEAKRLELLREAVPNASTIAVLINPKFGSAAEQASEVQTAAQSVGQQVVILKASAADDIDIAFTTIAEKRMGALLVAADPFLFSRRDQLIGLSARRAVPAIYQWRDFVAAGGLMSYGTDLSGAYRLLGIYTARVLKGEKPADLPVQQSTKVELALNLKTAKALGLTIPITLLGRADEVIE